MGRISRNDHRRSTVQDVLGGIKHFVPIFMLAQLRVFMPYRGTIVGPIWITLSMFAWAGLINLVFFTSLGRGDPIYLIYSTLGLVLFSFVQTCAIEGADTYRKSLALLQNSMAPKFSYVLLPIFIGSIFLFFHLPVLVIAFVVSGLPIQGQQFLALIGFIILLISCTGGVLLLSSLCVLFRDLSFGLAAIFRVLLFATPIFWHAEQRDGVRQIIANINPLSHFIALVRNPIVGEPVPDHSFIIAISITLVLWAAGLICFGSIRVNLIALAAR